MSSDIYQSMMDDDAEYKSRIMELHERLKAFPEDADAYEQGIDLCESAHKRWEECKQRLREMYERSDGDGEKAMLAEEINDADKKAKLYRSHLSTFINYKVSNTSKLHKFGKSLGDAGESMKSVGNAMSSTGDRMTIGCTVPAIAIAVLIFLFLFLL